LLALAFAGEVFEFDLARENVPGELAGVAGDLGHGRLR
jgi:hypothetical protein